MQHREIVVIGGGPISYTLAIHLATKNIYVTILEDDYNYNLVDARVLALSYASYHYLNSLNIWAKDPQFSSPINKVHVSHDGLGISIINASDVLLPSLGFTIKYNDLMVMLRKKISQIPQIVLKKCRVVAVSSSRNHATIDYVTNEHKIPETLTANLAIVAEGGKLVIDSVKYESFDYKQTAIVATLETSKLSTEIAYERFCADGAFVLLPYNSYFVMVWSVNTSKYHTEQCKTLTNIDILSNYIKSNKFFNRFGKIKVLGQISTYPLFKRVAKNKTLDSVVLIGNSAQTLHPVSAQGLNLGLRDVRILCENINLADFYGIRDQQFNLQSFDKLRMLDSSQTANITHYLAKFADIDNQFIKHLRGVGLIGLSNCKRLQNKIVNNLIFGI